MSRFTRVLSHRAEFRNPKKLARVLGGLFIFFAIGLFAVYALLYMAGVRTFNYLVWAYVPAVVGAAIGFGLLIASSLLNQRISRRRGECDKHHKDR